MVTVIHIRNKTGHPDEVYIGRGSPFGNPFKIGAVCSLCGQLHKDGGSTLNCFQNYFWRKLAADVQFNRLTQGLKGKTLVCFCKPKPCHGDIIKAWVDAN